MGRRPPPRAARSLLDGRVRAMIAGRWIDQAQNPAIDGPAGIGNNWLACALGHKACRDNRTVLYQRPHVRRSGIGTRRRPLPPPYARTRRRSSSLILDNWGLEPLGPKQRHDVLEIIENRCGRGATPDHQSNSGRSLACPDRRADPRRSPSSTASSITPIGVSSRATACASRRCENRRRLTQRNWLWRDHIRPAGEPPPAYIEYAQEMAAYGRRGKRSTW